MKRTTLLIVGGLLTLLTAFTAFMIFRPSAAPTGAMTAIPLAQPTTAPEPTAAPQPTTKPQPTAAPQPTTKPQPTATSPSEAQTFEIVSGESEARFSIDEVLRGAPITVVGKSDQISGQIAIDPVNPSQSRVGVIQINARALVTDNEFRNRAIRNAILETDRYEYISFAPTQISGMPERVEVGQSFNFQIMGDLTIRTVTRPVTFDVRVTADRSDAISGIATTTVLYRDFALRIPEVPSVDLVADEVVLELEFVARTK